MSSESQAVWIALQELLAEFLQAHPEVGLDGKTAGRVAASLADEVVTSFDVTAKPEPN